METTPEPEPAAGSAGGERGHRRRRAARRQALDILYESDLLGRAAREVMDEWRGAGRTISPYAVELVEGVADSTPQLDPIIGKSSEGWTVPRMPVVDRTILRVACYEIRSGVPSAVAISEAVHAAKDLSTGDSGRFVNGVLGKIARDLEEAAAPDQPAGGRPR